jgi:hypothetical protein
MEDKLFTLGLTTITTVFVAILTTIATTHRIRKEKLEILKSELYKKHLEAYIQLWIVLKRFSKNPCREESIIILRDKKHFLSKLNIIHFSNELTDFFHSKDGLFLSRKLRLELFGFRDELLEIFNTTDNELLPLSKSKYDKYVQKISSINTNLRSEIGLRDTVLPKKELGLIDKLESK